MNKGKRMKKIILFSILAAFILIASLTTDAVEPADIAEGESAFTDIIELKEEEPV